MQTESGGRKRYFTQTEVTRKQGLPILISDKTDFITKDMKKDKEGHYMMIQGPTEEDFTLVNMRAPHTWGHLYTEQTLTGRNPGTAGDAGIPLTAVKQRRHEMVQKEQLRLNGYF